MVVLYSEFQRNKTLGSALTNRGGAWTYKLQHMRECRTDITHLPFPNIEAYGYTLDLVNTTSNMTVILESLLFIDSDLLRHDALNFTWSFYGLFGYPDLIVPVPGVATLSSSFSNLTFEETSSWTPQYFDHSSKWGFFTHTGTIQYPRDNVLNATISATVGSIERGYLIYFNFANASIELTPAPSPDPKPGSGSTSKTAPIIGGAIGGALFLALIALITLVTIRIRQKKRIPEAKQETNTNEPDAAPNTERVGVEPTTLVIDQGISPVWAHLPDQEDLPPVYQDHGTLGAVTAPPPTPLELFVAAHPTWISPALGVKLQNAGYNPAFDPDLMSSERWLDKYGVDEFELAALREAFKAESVHNTSKVKEEITHSAGEVGSSWRPP